MSMIPNISVLSVKSLYLRSLESDVLSADLCRSLTRVSTVFLILAEGNWLWKLYGSVILPHGQNAQGLGLILEELREEAIFASTIPCFTINIKTCQYNAQYH